jgi:hypothetical protein
VAEGMDERAQLAHPFLQGRVSKSLTDEGSVQDAARRSVGDEDVGIGWDQRPSLRPLFLG